MRQTITSQLREETDNSFLWLKVVIKSIDLPSIRNIKETIKNSPQDLDDLYHLLVQRLDERGRDNGRLLACVVYARCPLDRRALQDAAAINPREKYTYYEQCEQDNPALGFSEVYNAFGTLLDVEEDNKVYFIH